MGLSTKLLRGRDASPAHPIALRPLSDIWNTVAATDRGAEMVVKGNKIRIVAVLKDMPAVQNDRCASCIKTKLVGCVIRDLISSTSLVINNWCMLGVIIGRPEYLRHWRYKMRREHSVATGSRDLEIHPHDHQRTHPGDVGN